MEEKKEFVIYLKHRAIKHSFGLFDHWFIDVPDKNLEIHPGNYEFGTHLTSGTTKNAHIYCTKTVCMKCLDHILKDTVDLKYLFYYPFINCETLASHHFTNMAISTQLILLSVVVISFTLGLFNVIFFYIMVLFIIIYLLYSKYLYSTSKNYTCLHLIEQNKQ